MGQSTEAQMLGTQAIENKVAGDQGGLAQFRNTDGYPMGRQANVGHVDRMLGTANILQASMRGDGITEAQALPRFSDDDLAKGFAATLLDRGRLDMESPTGQALFVELYQRYQQSGAKGMQDFLDKVNKELGGDFKLSMREDPELLKKAQDDAKAKGKSPPDFLRWIDMKDNKGRDRGNLLFIHSQKQERPPGTPI